MPTLAVRRARARCSWHVRHADRGVPSPPPTMATLASTAAGQPLASLIAQASSLLAPEHVQRAHSLAREMMSPLASLIENPQAGVQVAAYYVGPGVPAPRNIAMADVAARTARLLEQHLCLELGQALAMVGHPTESIAMLGALADSFVDPAGPRLSAAELGGDARAGRFLRETFTYWGQAARRGGSDPRAARAVYETAAERGVWQEAWQRPLEHYRAGLCRRPFWDAASLPAARALESAHPAILAECLALLNRGDAAFASYKSRVVTAGAWSDVQFYAGCKRDEEHCAACPATAAVIAAQPRINTVIHGSHFFSRLAPGTHLSAHCGPSNFRLRCHLGLVVPPGVRIRVANEVREWKQGECLIFDDSFEHEVWHDGDSDRVVLICDLWHPELDLDSTIVPFLSPEQREALGAASAGKHLPLFERTYSTGATVARGARGRPDRGA